MLNEQRYDYPRRFAWPLEFVASVVALAGFVHVGRYLIGMLVHRTEVQKWSLDQDPRLRQIISWLLINTPVVDGVLALIAPLLWLLLALVVAQWLRDLFPAVRLSSRGLLVEWSGGWVPVQWSGLHRLRLTEGRNERFVALVQTDSKQLTGWHRWYSLLYRPGLRRGFLITSAIQRGDDLLRDIIEERNHLSKLGMANDFSVDAKGASPFFRLFMGRPQPPVAPAPAPMIMAPPPIAAPMPPTAPVQAIASAPPAPTQPAGEAPVTATYPNWLTTVLFAVTILISGLALWKYLRAWATFLYYQFPSQRGGILLRMAQQNEVASSWGILLGAHLGLAAVAGVVWLGYHLFPAITADHEGLQFTVLGRSQRLGWHAIKAVKATPLQATPDRDDRYVALIEGGPRALPWWYGVGTWAYEGGIGRGALVWPLIRQFEPLMERIASELTRQPVGDDDAPLLRDDAPGWLVLLVTRPAQALDQLVHRDPDATDDSDVKLDRRRIAQVFPAMLWLALLPALVLLAYNLLFRGELGFRFIGLFIFAAVWGLIEWPLTTLVARAIDDSVGSGVRGFAGLYLYPTAQLPRILPVAAALLLVLLGQPLLAWLVWGGGIIWSGVLAAGLWEALYSWRGAALIAGAVPGVIMQGMTLFAVIGLG